MKAKPSKRKIVPGTADEKPVALTLKVDSKTFMRLSILRAKQRSTIQEILMEALSEHLDRVGA